MRLSDVFIDRVREVVSVVGLISGYVRLKKSGKDYAALCPFHHEKTPSFMVSESKQIFKCFGCGAGGDVFGFIMRMEKLTFPESILYLAERHGIPLPQTARKDEALDQKQTRFFEIMESACCFFQDTLQRSNDALRYLQDRQIETETIKKFRVGYAAVGSQLLQELQRQGLGLEEISACGLVRKGDSGQFFDRFRNRIMFPIHDLSGRTIAFGGRILGDGKPKYLNSPDTVLYKKSNHLYPLNITRDDIRRKDFSVLVEGYFDCLVPYQHGIRNVVASLGTSLTQNQTRLLGRYTRNVIINYDPDLAGTAAAMRSIDLFLEMGFRANVLQLPQGSDPDTFLRLEGRKAYLEKMKSSQSYLDFALARFISQHKNPFGPRGKEEIVSKILPYLGKIPNRIERAEYVTRVASCLEIDGALIVAEMNKRPRIGNVQSGLNLHRMEDKVTPSEAVLINALFDSEWTKVAFKELEAHLFEGLSTERIFEAALRLYSESKKTSVVNLRGLVAEDDQDLLESLALRESGFPLSEELIKNSALALRKKQYERLSLQIQNKIQSSKGNDSDSARTDELLVEKEKIHKKIRQLEST